MHDDPAPAERLVRDPTGVPAVDAAGAAPAARAGGGRASPTDLEMGGAVDHEYALEVQTSEVGKQGRDSQ
jgi:hypothetical protein